MNLVTPIFPECDLHNPTLISDDGLQHIHKLFFTITSPFLFLFQKPKGVQDEMYKCCLNVDLKCLKKCEKSII